MKTIKYYTALLFVSVMLFTVSSCSEKEGPMGTQGPQGEQGIPGVAGKDGGVFYSGNGAPTTTLGSNGDMYLDKSASNLYGPKTDSGWGAPLNLKGATGAKGSTGATGSPGSKILSGTGNPKSVVGAFGDYYLNITTGDLFGPKTASGWGTPINLKGTANVIASTWIDWLPWAQSTSVRIKQRSYSIPLPFINAVGFTKLDDFVNNGGTMLVYIKRNSYYFPLPHTHIDGGYEWKAHWYGRTENSGNKFYFMVRELKATSLPSYILTQTPGEHKLRYVLIPAGKQLPGEISVSRSTSDIDWNSMSYTEVKNALQLPN